MSQITSSSYGSASAITPSDTTPVVCRAIYVGGAGNLSVQMGNGSATVVITAPPVGTILPLAIENGRIMAATTATALVALI
jgi:hypothetical protein